MSTEGNRAGPCTVQRDMTRLGTEGHLFLARDYIDTTSQLLEHFLVEAGEDLTALGCNFPPLH